MEGDLFLPRTHILLWKNERNTMKKMENTMKKWKIIMKKTGKQKHETIIKKWKVIFYYLGLIYFYIYYEKILWKNEKYYEKKQETWDDNKEMEADLFLPRTHPIVDNWVHCAVWLKKNIFFSFSKFLDIITYIYYKWYILLAPTGALYVMMP